MNHAYANSFNTAMRKIMSNDFGPLNPVDNSMQEAAMESWLDAKEEEITCALSDAEDYWFEYALNDDKELWDPRRIQYKDVCSQVDMELFETTKVIDHSLRGKQQDKIISKKIDDLAKQYAKAEFEAMVSQ